MKDKPVLVTGLSGLIGSALQRVAGRRELIDARHNAGVDILDWGGLMEFARRQRQIGAVIHLAAFTNVSGAFEQLGEQEAPCYQLNVSGTRNVVDVCRELDLFLVHVSTDFVFPGDRDTPYTEQDTPAPIEWYGETKLLAEQAVRGLERSAIARIAFPYAAGATPRADVVRTLLGKLRAGEPLSLFEDQIVTPTFADDIATGLLALADAGDEHELSEGELFHLTGPDSLSPFELGQAIARVFDLPADKIEPSSLADYLAQDPRPRQRCLRMNNAKWRAWASDHGLAAPFGIEEGLSRVRASLE